MYIQMKSFLVFFSHLYWLNINAKANLCVCYADYRAILHMYVVRGTEKDIGYF